MNPKDEWLVFQKIANGRLPALDSCQRGKNLKGALTDRFNLAPDWRIQHMSAFIVTNSHIAPPLNSDRQRTQQQFELDPLMLTVAYIQQLRFALDSAGTVDEARVIQQEMAKLDEYRKREEEHWSDMGHYLD